MRSRQRERGTELTIIFSTIPLVSPSKSLSFEFSGLILVVSILGALVTMCGHQVCWLTFSSDSEISLESSVPSYRH